MEAKNIPFGFSVIPTNNYSAHILNLKKQGDIYLYGEHNEYPYFILNLYKKSAKHSAIINSKANYIYGNGWGVKHKNNVLNEALAEKFLLNPNTEDSINELTHKIILDNEIYNGFAIAVTWSKSGTIAFLEHIPFELVRKSCTEDAYYISDWYDDKMIRNTQSSGALEKMPAFNPSYKKGKQLYYHVNYYAGCKLYPLPNYHAAIPYIECDTEIAKFHINNIRNQFWGGQMITFNDGIPTPEEMSEIERQIKKKFSGSENAGRFVLTFSNGKENSPIIQSLAPSDLDKQFDLLNSQIQEEIFVAHNVTSPMLFGVRVEGQLGGRSELVESYELFKNTYINGRVQQIETCINYLASFNGITELELKPLIPVTTSFTETTLLQIMTPDELRERAGLPKLNKKPSDEDVTNAINTLSPLVANKVLEVMSPNEVRGLASLPPKADGEKLSSPTGTETPIEATKIINESIKGLTGRQYQNLMRIVRHHAQGKLSDAQAQLMIASGFGLEQNEIEMLLGLNQQEIEQEFSAVDITNNLNHLRVVGLHFGADVNDYEVIFERGVEFSFEELLSGDEVEYRKQYYESTLSFEDKTLDLKIIKYRTKNEEATAKEMAKEFNVSLKKIKERIQYLMDNNKYPIKEAIDKFAKKDDSIVSTMYKYDWRPEYANLSRAEGYDKSREFCKTMMDLAKTKLYTRTDIDSISRLVGINVWEQRGGWLTLPDGRHRPSCRHLWKQQLVVKKDDEISRVAENSPINKKINDLVSISAKDAEKIHKGDITGYDRMVYRDIEGRNIANLKSAEEIKKEIGAYISTERIYQRPNVEMPRDVDIHLKELGKEKVMNLINKNTNQKLKVDDINIVQEYVFEIPLKKAIDRKNYKVVVYEYKGRYYLNDGNHRVAAAKLNNVKEIEVVVEKVD